MKKNTETIAKISNNEVLSIIVSKKMVKYFLLFAIIIISGIFCIDTEFTGISTTPRDYAVIMLSSFVFTFSAHGLYSMLFKSSFKMFTTFSGIINFMLFALNTYQCLQSWNDEKLVPLLPILIAITFGMHIIVFAVSLFSYSFFSKRKICANQK